MRDISLKDGCKLQQSLLRGEGSISSIREKHGKRSMSLEGMLVS